MLRRASRWQQPTSAAAESAASELDDALHLFAEAHPCRVDIDGVLRPAERSDRTGRIGLVADGKYQSLGEDERPFFYPDRRLLMWASKD